MTDRALAFAANCTKDTLDFLEHIYPVGVLEDFQLITATQDPDGSNFRGTMSFKGEGALPQCAEYVNSQRRDREVFFGFGLRSHEVKLPGTGLESQIAALPGLVLDIDVGGKDEFKSLSDAREFLNGLLRQPTLTVRSGSGLHTYWLYHELWVFDSNEERNKARKLYHGWYRYLRDLARSKFGVKLDSTATIQRVWRPVGSLNHKPELSELHLVVLDGPVKTRQRYSEILDFEEWEHHSGARSIDTPSKTVLEGMSAKLEMSTDTVLPESVHTALLLFQDFAEIWHHSQRGKKDETQSGWDFEIALFGIRSGWPTQVIADAMMVNRRQFSPDVKKKEDQWYALTLTNAYQAIHGSELELVEMWSTDPKEAKLKQLRQATNAPVRKVLRLGTLEDAEYVAFLEDGNEYPLGFVSTAVSQARWRGIALTVGIAPPVKSLKREHWQGLIEAVLANAGVRDEDILYASDTNRFREAVQDYINKHELTPFKKRTDVKDLWLIVRRQDSYSLEDELWIQPEDLRIHLRTKAGTVVSPGKIARQFRRCGFRAEKVQAHIPKDMQVPGQPTNLQATYYVIAVAEFEK